MSVAPKRPKGPPLNAMRAFEAAARHTSFVAAAEELNVTPGAVSQHIKTLENWADAPLFRRNAQGVELTPAGASLSACFTDAFDALADAARSLRNLKPDADFHIAALPSVAQLWLPKRLGRIRAQFPHITFSVTALETPPSLTRELFDLAIFIGDPRQVQTPHSVTICADEILPVCAPNLLDDSKGFIGATLLHDQSWAADWRLWSEKTGIAVADPDKGPQFSLYSLAVEEAKAGAGVLMGHTCLIADALAHGSLVPASQHSCQTGQALYCALPHRARQRPETDQIVTLLSDTGPAT